MGTQKDLVKWTPGHSRRGHQDRLIRVTNFLYDTKKTFLAFRCRGMLVEGLHSRVMGTDIYRAEPVLCNQPLCSMGCLEHHPDGLPALQEPASRQSKHLEHAFPYNQHSLTCHYPSQHGGQCISRLMSRTFSQVQFHPHPKGPLLAGWREKAALSRRVSTARHSQSRSPTAARLAPFVLVEYAKQYISEKNPGCQVVLCCLQLPVMRIN